MAPLVSKLSVIIRRYPTTSTVGLCPLCTNNWVAKWGGEKNFCKTGYHGGFFIGTKTGGFSGSPIALLAKRHHAAKFNNTRFRMLL